MDDIKSRLEQKNVRLEDFQAINALLISRGFLSRDDGARHRVLYHITQRAQAEVEDVLFFIYGATLQHDKTTNHYRLLPFGNREDGLPDPSDEMEIRRELKGSLIKDFVAALLTLRLLHDEKIGERRIEAGGRVAVRVTEFATALKVHFKTEMPATESGRRSVFLKLKKLGVAELDIDNLKDEDAIISIRPEIATLVYDSAIGRALEVIENAGAADTDRAAPSVVDDAVELEPASEFGQ
jgi:hypothetical protein